jgi:FkbM family methyltransferase
MERSFTDTLSSLAQKGLRYATVFDLGSADGHFFVDHYLQGLFQEAVPVNIDANPVYEPSLQQVRETFGGHYRIAAASDHAGEIDMTMSIHPYWSSLRSRDDLYWVRLNKLTSGVQRVPVMRLDDLVAELGLRPPFLLKLDVQGAEVQALRGARKMLADTSVVICEADVADFQAINAELLAAGFFLYDITVVRRIVDQTLAWFYPIYLNERLAHLKPRSFWQPSNNDSVIQAQIKRREEILAHLAEVLPQIRAARARKPG